MKRITTFAAPVRISLCLNKKTGVRCLIRVLQHYTPEDEIACFARETAAIWAPTFRAELKKGALTPGSPQSGDVPHLMKKLLICVF